MAGIAVAVLALGVLGAGVYLRLNSTEQTQEESASAILQGAIPSSAAALAGDIAIPVSGVAAVRDTLIITVRAAGDADASLRTVITPQVGGRVMQVSARENASAPRGQTLVILDPVEYELRLQEAQVALTNAQAAYTELTLFDDRIEDPAAREERERFARSRSGLEAAELALRRAQIELERTRITAPIAGRIASIKVIPGEWISAGTELMTILDLDPIRVEVQVMEGEIGYLSAGRGARVTFAAFPGEVFAGRIESINPIVGESSLRHARVTVTVPNPDGRILPGMYAQVALDAREYPDRVIVPREAILERDVDRRKMLFVYEEGSGGGRAKWRYVTTGLENDTHVEILADVATDSVKPGEIVLTSGHYTLIHDARISLVDSAASTQ